MIAISRFQKMFSSCFPSLSPLRFFCVELCWIAFETLQTETGKKLKRNCSCSIQFSFLKLSEKLRTLKTLYVEKLLNFLSHKKEKKSNECTLVCLKHFLRLPLSTTFRTKCFPHKFSCNIHKRNKLKKISGFFFSSAGFSFLLGGKIEKCKKKRIKCF